MKQNLFETAEAVLDKLQKKQTNRKEGINNQRHNEYDGGKTRILRNAINRKDKDAETKYIETRYGEIEDCMTMWE